MLISFNRPNRHLDLDLSDIRHFFSFDVDVSENQHK